MVPSSPEPAGTGRWADRLVWCAHLRPWPVPRQRGTGSSLPRARWWRDRARGRRRRRHPLAQRNSFFRHPRADANAVVALRRRRTCSTSGCSPPSGEPPLLRLRRQGVRALHDRDRHRGVRGPGLGGGGGGHPRRRQGHARSPRRAAGGGEGGARGRGRAAATRARHQGRPVRPGEQAGPLGSGRAVRAGARWWPRRTSGPTAGCSPVWAWIPAPSPWWATRCAPTCSRCSSLGGRAVHVPYPITWALEDADPGAAAGRYEVLDDLRGLPDALDRLDGGLTQRRSACRTLRKAPRSAGRTEGAGQVGQGWVKQRASRVQADQPPHRPR